MIITYWRKKITGNVLPKEEGKVDGGREERFHNIKNVPLESLLTPIFMDLSSYHHLFCVSFTL